MVGFIFPLRPLYAFACDSETAGQQVGRTRNTINYPLRNFRTSEYIDTCAHARYLKVNLRLIISAVSLMEFFR
jgi:hypothetical protein